MRIRTLAAGLLTAAFVLTGAVISRPALAQNVFYIEVPKDGRIYVFANGARYDAFQKSGGAEMGASLTRPGYGPNGETVVFDSEDAVNLYNFKHDLPGEYFPKPAEAPKSPYPQGKFSGLMFGDYFFYDKWHADQVSATNTTDVSRQNGFWMRRIYFTYDLAFNEKFSTRFRVEANSNGQFASTANLNPYVKDAWVKWIYHGQHQAMAGIVPTLGFDWLEGFWGLRHIEKTPADLYKIDSSRDFGITFSGPIGHGFSYAGQFGNDSSVGSEIDKYKIFRFEGRYERNPGFVAEVFFSESQRPAEQDRTTAQGIAGYRNKVFRAGGQYLWQQRDSGIAGTPNLDLGIWSVFGVWEFLPGKADVFARIDDVKGDLDGTDTGLPGANTIDYLLISPAQPFQTYIFGGEWFITPSIRVGPNVEWVKYDNDPDPVNFPGRDEALVYRATFFWTF